MRPYFEGWYFKQQGDSSVALIPSFSRTADGGRAQLQVVTPQGTGCIEYPYDALKFNRRNLEVSLGENRFSLSGIRLDAKSRDLELKGELDFSGTVRPKYDIMGPFKAVPLMECRHSVFSLRHSVSGRLTVNGETFSFDRGEGYIEGDRGYSFPKHYTWVQGFFKGGSLMLSVAEIPFCGFRFTGVVGFVYCGAREYRLATYLGARAARDGRRLQVRQGKYLLQLELPENDGHRLSAPVGGRMLRSIRESLCVGIRCMFKIGENEVLDSYCDMASFEDE